jgi:high affinity sulfate transporter 1
MARNEGRSDGVTNGSAAEGVPLVHKVEVPPKRNVFREVGAGLWELFFHDAPVGQFKGQSRRRKSLLGLKFLFPILDWITTYTPKMLLGDFIAGCTIASLAVPQVGETRSATPSPSLFTYNDLSLMSHFVKLQDLGYAKLAGVPPVNGLCKKLSLLLLSKKVIVGGFLFLGFSEVFFSMCGGADSSFVPPLVYSLLGSSRDIAIGPVAVVSLLLGTLLKQELSPTDDPENYLKLAFTATFFCGVFQTGLGVFRCGFPPLHSACA